MSKSEKKKRKLPGRVRKILEKVSKRLTLESCGVSDACKAEIRLYLDTWIKGPIDSVIAYDDGKLRGRDLVT